MADDNGRTAGRRPAPPGHAVGVPTVEDGAASLLRNSGMLVAARAVQALFGAVTFVVVTRRIGAAGFGEVVTTFGFASVVGGVLGMALSDAAVTTGGQLPRVGKVPAVVALASACAVSLVWIITDGHDDAALGVVGAALYVAASAGSAGRTAVARALGNARGLSCLQAAGALATLVFVASLATGGVRQWGPYVIAYALQPAALLLLPAPPRVVGGPSPAAPLREVVRLAGPFLLSQAVWPLLALTNIVVLRALQGPEAVGRYGAMVRMLDLVGVVGPLLGMFALPAFARLQRDGGRPGSPEISRLNLTIAATGTLPVVAGMHLAWAGWQVAYPDLRFPVVAFGLLAAAYGVNAACGLPDRILQSAGGAGVVARAAVAALAVLAVLSPVLVSASPLIGSAVALLVAVGGVNVAMLVATRPAAAAVAGHLAIGAVVGASAAAVASGWSSGSVERSLFLVLAATAPLVLVAQAFNRRLRQGVPAP